MNPTESVHSALFCGISFYLSRLPVVGAHKMCIIIAWEALHMRPVFVLPVPSMGASFLICAALINFPRSVCVEIL